ncbi:fAD dependent oxidoreductase [Lactobacillus crispatus]|uniref:FAD-dependent oxidoreductase n=1 Tax=Lactobacillus crispatus TaxID=47770 RepID=UPI0018E2D83E|nr:FAD-dependent oxidoreductase [Lactobacillus crispatus]MBI1700538.1 fAD dependent oxidoreductase [Lactobacillus crispatus]
MERVLNYDVVVVGGGAAGIAAALSSAKEHKTTLLVEREASLGGQGVNSQVASYCGFYTRGTSPDLVVGGIGKQVLERMGEMGMDITPHPSSSTGNVSIKFDPEKMKIIFDNLFSESDSDVLLHTSVVSVNVENQNITQIICSDDDGLFTVNTKEIVDATGNGNILNLAGLTTEWGDKNGQVQQASLPFRIDHLPKRAISMAEMQTAVQKGKANGIQYLSKEKGVLIKNPKDSYGYVTLPSVTVEEIDAKSMTNYEVSLRRQVWSYFKAIKNYLPNCENATLVFSGPNLGIREARRMVGKITLTGLDILKVKKRKDSIGRAAWSPEIHHSDNKLEYNHMPDNDYASIPLGALKAKEIKNLWGAGRLISVDHMAQASVRVMGTSFITGQAAGVAAALSVNSDTISVVEVRNALLKQNVLL